MVKVTVQRLTLVFLVLLSAAVQGQQVARPWSSPLSDEQIDKLINNLDDDAFDVRQQAAKKLAAIGPRAFDALAKAAQHGSLEAQMRCFDILTKALQSENEQVAAAAKKTLQQLANAPNPAVAHRARSALRPPQPPPSSNAGGLQVQRMQIQHAGQKQAVVVVATAGGGVGAMRIQVQTQGETVTQVKTGGKTVRIVENARGPIEVSITEEKPAKGGGKKTETFKAKNLAELKKKYPAAYQLYQKYGQRHRQPERPQRTNTPGK